MATDSGIRRISSRHPVKSVKREFILERNVTRQQRRAKARAIAWVAWCCNQNAKPPIGPTDERGIIPRRTRRSIAAARSKLKALPVSRK